MKAEKEQELIKLSKELIRPSCVIEGVLIIRCPVKTFEGGRGVKIFDVDLLNAYLKSMGKPEFRIVQLNQANSVPGVIRAFHAEGWNKLAYATGRMFSILIDTREDSPTKGKFEIVNFDLESPINLFIPKGVANSVAVKHEPAAEHVQYLYCVDKPYDGSDTTTYAFDDPMFVNLWGIDNPIVSVRDRQGIVLSKLHPDWF